MADILVIDDEIEICLILEKFLKKKGFGIETCTSGKEGLYKLKSNKYDLVISDFRLPDYNGLELLKNIKETKPYQKVIIITGYSDIRMAVEVIKYGASDYITKPLYPEELLNLINDTLSADSKSSHSDVEEMDDEPVGDVVVAQRPIRDKVKTDYIIGKSKNSSDVHKNIVLVAPTPMSVIISGETGTGKEYVAKEIHAKSNRRDKPFVAIDCGALPKDIAGSEFFGHEKGSFTGAIKEKDGKFKYANGGTLFLDEIGNLTYEIQIKLLRVLQERKYTRIGGEKDISVDVRIVAASNEDLKKATENGTFREDLYYRLNEFNIDLFPIRERTEDLPEFIQSFIHLANEQLGKNVEGISKEVEEKFWKYPWPGNLRELKNVIKRSVLLSDGKSIELKSLPDEIVYYTDRSNVINDNSLRGIANEAEREKILKVLSQTGNNKSKAAKILNIDRKTLYNKLKTYDI